MRRTSRSVRVLVLVASAAALVGLGTPPASAGDGGVYSMAGTANIPAGVGNPCTPVGTLDCTAPPNVNPACATTGLKKCGVVDWNNGVAPMLTGTFSSDVCVGAESNFGIKGKGALPINNAGTCGMKASFNLLGWCGLSHGMGSGLISHFGAFGTNTTLFDFLWTEVLPTGMVLHFQWWKGSHVKPANPNKGIGSYSATPSVAGTLTGQSCTNHTMRDINLMGTFVFLPVKNI